MSDSNPTGKSIRIRLQAYDHKIIDKAADTIMETAQRNDADITGPVPLPTSVENFSVKRSPFVTPQSHEQFERRTHKRLIDVDDLNPKAIDALMNLNLPSGVDVEIKMR
ncbi:MAG: 30S ribosomal protein S10 [Candidatus Paceibacteria bacterium]